LEFSNPGQVETEFGMKSFLSLSQPGLDLNIARMIFFFFLQFFWEFSKPGCVETEFGTKIIFPLCRPISTRFGLKYC